MHARPNSLLIAGVGNVLHGDDGFGIRVAQRLMLRMHELPPGTKVMETGIGGMSLIQELMYGYNALALVDAYAKGGRPGQLYMLEPVLPDTANMNMHTLRDYFSDTHYATPFRALSFLDNIGRLPATVRVFGCEPGDLDGLRLELSPPVAAAVEPAVAMVLDWVRGSPFPTNRKA